MLRTILLTMVGALLALVLYEGWFWLARALDRRGLARFIRREEDEARDAEERRRRP